MMKCRICGAYPCFVLMDFDELVKAPTAYACREHAVEVFMPMLDRKVEKPKNGKR